MNLGCLKDFTFVYAPIKVMSAGPILSNDNLSPAEISNV